MDTADAGPSSNSSAPLAVKRRRVDADEDDVDAADDRFHGPASTIAGKSSLGGGTAASAAAAAPSSSGMSKALVALIRGTHFDPFSSTHWPPLPPPPASATAAAGGASSSSSSVASPATDRVPYAYLADALSDISATSSRLECMNLLTFTFVAILQRSPQDLLPAVYLVINRLGPAHLGLELGIGDALMTKIIADMCSLTEKRVKELYQETGDLAEVAQDAKKKVKTLFKGKPLTVERVFKTLQTMATTSGKESATKKQQMAQALIRDAFGPEVNFLVRAMQGKMRIGLAEPSLLQALGCAVGLRDITVPTAQTNTSLEELHTQLTFAVDSVTRAYHECPSFDILVPALVQHGIRGCFLDAERKLSLSIRPGLPVKPMLAHPTTSVTAVLDRFEGNPFVSEFKYDGERAQLHFVGGTTFHIYSRNSENHTEKYPDLIQMLPSVFDPAVVQSFIVDSEVVAVDAQGNLQPFQALQHRARKSVDIADVTVQVCVMAFDILFFNGRSLLDCTLRERREILRNHFKATPLGAFRFAEGLESTDVEQLHDFLNQSIKAGCEGLMVKTLDHDAAYTPFKRSYHWLKLKKDYMDGAGDTLDLVPIGAYQGKGKRTGVYGGYLLACYDPDNEEYQSVCKIGTGFTDEMLGQLTTTVAPLVAPSPMPYYRYAEAHAPDVWLREGVVWEVKAADLTLSPVHMAALGLIDAARGVALRFPRFMRVREDKQPTDATSSRQIEAMYRAQALAVAAAERQQPPAAAFD